MNSIVNLIKGASRRCVLCVMLICFALGTVAQGVSASVSALSVGRISHGEVIRLMPQYAEAQRSEKEFQTKFEDFLQTQKDLSQTILNKRQNELQAMMDANIQFRIKVQTLLKDAEDELMAGVKAVLREAIASVAAEQGLAFVINTDAEGLSYISPDMARDITGEVIAKLGIAVER